MHYHSSWDGFYNGKWVQDKRYYGVIMKHPDAINYITVLREPKSHLLSYYY
ncbi:unnamed protein product, partial [Choristocarpus tenellus]